MSSRALLAALPTLVTALALAVGGSARADVLSWNNGAGGSVATSTNWLPVKVPAAADQLVFNLNGTYGVTFPNTVPVTASHTVRRGRLSFSTPWPHALSGAYLQGTASGDDASVTLEGTISAAATSHVGQAVGSDVQLTVTGLNSVFQVTSAGADLLVGNNGTGRLSIQDGGLVRVADNVNIGNVAGAFGVVQVSRTSGTTPSTLSTENASGDIFVGTSGSGILTVSFGGEVLSKGAVRIGGLSGSQGQVTVGGGTGESRLTATTGLSVGGEAGAQVGGDGSLQVNANGTVLSLATLDVGDVTGGQLSSLILSGGTVHTRDLLVHATRGEIDFRRGTLRVDGGTLDYDPASWLAIGALPGTTAAFEIIRSAQGTIASGLSMSADDGATASLLVDSGADLFVDGVINAVAGMNTIVVDSGATLTTSDRIYLAGTNSASLTIGTGSIVNVPSMECTDDTGGTSSVLLSGPGARLRVDGFLGVGGDEANDGGPTTMTVQNGGRVESDTPAMRLLIRGPGFVDVKSTGEIHVADQVDVEGRLRLEGPMFTGTLALAGNGRVEARGTVLCDVIGNAPGATIEAIGELELGNVASPNGYDFRGTLRCGGFVVRVRDGGVIQLGDSTLADGGTLNSSSALIHAGVIRGHGTIEASSLGNSSGTVEVEDENFASWNLVGSYLQGTSATLALRVGGSNAGQFDRLVASGSVAVGGTLRLVFPPGAALTQGVAIPLVTGSSRAGTFSALVVEGFASPQALLLTYTPTQVLLTLQAAVDAPPAPAVPTVLAFTGGSGSVFRLDLPEPAEARVEVFDVTGRRVAVLADERLPAGAHRLAWNRGRGIWFARATIRTAGDAVRRLSDRLVVP